MAATSCRSRARTEEAALRDEDDAIPNVSSQESKTGKGFSGNKEGTNGFLLALGYEKIKSIFSLLFHENKKCHKKATTRSSKKASNSFAR